MAVTWQKLNELSSSTPTLDDLVPTLDLANPTLLRKTTWQLVRNLFASYFDTVYATITSLSWKADVSTTLLGYGITNAYTKTETDVYNPDFYKYSIVRTVASGNLIVSIKNYEGNDPTPTKPVKVQIGWVVRSITSALSVTNVAWYNWLNLGSNELATKETDIFVYLVWRSWESTVRLTSARFPNATIYNDFNSDALNEKWNLWNFVSPVSNDPVVNIGRFNAILSAGAGYTWSIPATSMIINSPIYETRWLYSTPSLTWSGTAPTGGTTTFMKYRINGSTIEFLSSKRIMTAWVSNTILDISLPFWTILAWWSEYMPAYWWFSTDITPNSSTVILWYISSSIARITANSINATAYYISWIMPI